MSKYVVWLFAFICFPPLHAFSQKIGLQVLTPAPGSVVPNANLFISVRLDSGNQFTSANQVDVFLDGFVVKGVTKVNGSKMSFVYPNIMRSGKHTIRVEVKLKGAKRPLRGSWDFYAGKKDGIAGDKGTRGADEGFRLDGIVCMDNRAEMLSGTGQSLRQEPPSTRTLTVDAVAGYKGIEIPVKVFMTNNNVPGLQSMNYYQAGFRTSWLDITAGDMNMAADRLVLSGVRVRGFSVKLNNHATFLQVFYGDMARPFDGLLKVYTPGTGILPTNLVNDSQYVAPGTYKRKMMAARLELVSPKDDIKLCASAFKAKDEVGSISYGLTPKDNVAGGVDLTLKLFRRKVVIQGGIAISIITNDISSGPLTKEQLDTSYKVNSSIDPSEYKNIIILNASTLPAQLTTSFDNMAAYSQLTYNNKFQNFTVDFKNYGPLYYSLGNPFLLNNYSGMTARERFWLFGRKLNIGLGYQNYSNNLNGASAIKVYTQGYNANITVSPGLRWPTFMLYYMNQNRNGKSELVNRPGINDVLSNYMFNVLYGSKFWNLTHQFRIMVNISNRNDLINTQNKFSSVNSMIGVSERISEAWNVSADFGKAVISGFSNGTISDINIYNFSVDWQIKPRKYFTALSVSNSQTLMTLYSNESHRLSIIGRFGYKFYRGMAIDLQGGYQPFIDQTNSANSYSEVYAYIRYTCELGSLLGSER